MSGTSLTRSWLVCGPCLLAPDGTLGHAMFLRWVPRMDVYICPCCHCGFTGRMVHALVVGSAHRTE